jgi:sporulation protein YlmC with PRC-barrel domain
MALAIAAAFGFATASTIGTLPAHSQPAAADLVVVDVAVVGKGYRTSRLTGRAVVNDKNERIGTVDDFVIGRDRVLFTILQVGGFLGIGSRLVAVPYRSIVIDDTGERITLPGATKEQLERLREFRYL